MSDTCQLNLTFGTVPTPGGAQGAAYITTPLCETLLFYTAKQLTELTLNTDGATSVPFGGVTSATFVYVRVLIGQNLAATIALTSTAGTLQVVPCDNVFFLVSGSSGITAMTIARSPGTVQQFEIFLGQ